MKSYLSVAVLALLGSNVEAGKASMSKGNIHLALLNRLETI